MLSASFTDVLQSLPSLPLERLRVSGFKSVRDSVELEIRPLTLLAGRNSSGKSSVLQALLLLKQTFDAPYDPGDLLINGVNVRFSQVEQMFWKGRTHKDKRDEFAVGLGFGSAFISSHFTHKNNEIRLDRTVVSKGENLEPLVLRPGVTHEELMTNKVATPDKNLLGEIQLSVHRTRCVYDVAMVHSSKDGGKLSFPIGITSIPFSSMLTKAIHLPGLRGNPERDYPSAQVGSVFPGLFHLYCASIVRAWRAKDDPRLRRLSDWLKGLGLTWKVDARPVDASKVELLVGRLATAARGGAEDLVSIADVGVGVSQVLPVLVALLVAEAGQLVCIEQPEIHLHPEAQLKLADCFVETAKRGVIVIAETHSHLLLQGVQHAVAHGFDPEHVKLHWFERGDEGCTSVKSSSIDGTGAFGDWPVDFADVELRSERRLLDAAAARRK